MDGRSAAMWLVHQFAVAVGAEDSASKCGPIAPPSLRGSPVSRAAPQPRRRAAAIWHRRGPASRARRWHTIHFPCGHLRRWIRQLSAFTYNDLLATAALETFAAWNRLHRRSSAIALWLPVEIRRAGQSGFGNGTSRIRVHVPVRERDPFFVTCRHVHDAISDAMRSGEWRVPERLAVMRLPSWLMRATLRLYFNRPGVDIGSIAFSHVEYQGAVPGGIGLDRVECIGPLHASHPCAIYGVTRGVWTSITFTYDPALLAQEDVEALAVAFQSRVAAATRQLTCAA
jgi:hypothetical protein